MDRPDERTLVWDCYGLCTGTMWLDLLALASGLLLLAWLLVHLRRVRASRGRGEPGRMVALGLLGTVLSLPFLGSALRRVCVTSALGVRLGCRVQVLVPVIVHGLALFAAGVILTTLARDLRPDPSTRLGRLKPRGR